MDILQKYKLRALRRTDRLTIAIIVLGCIIIIGLLTNKKTKLSYEITTEQILAEVIKNDFVVQPDRLPQIIKNEKYKIVDCRNSADFAQGHIENAIHIPKHNLLTPTNLKQFEDQSYTYLIYGNNTAEANSLWMLLKQLGYGNIKIIAGGYSEDNHGAFHPDVAKYDYEKLMQEATVRNQITSDGNSIQSKKPPSKKILPKKKAKKHHTDGGC